MGSVEPMSLYGRMPAPIGAGSPHANLFQRLRLAGGKIGLDLTQLV